MAEVSEKVLRKVIDEAEDIDYGKLELIVKDGRVIDIVKQKRSRIK